MLDIREDDLSGDAVRALLAYHLTEMRGSSPPGHSFALDLTGLRGRTSPSGPAGSEIHSR